MGAALDAWAGRHADRIAADSPRVIAVHEANLGLAQGQLAEQQRAIILRKTRERKQKNCEGGRGLLPRNVPFADAFGHCTTVAVEGCEHYLAGFIGFRKATFWRLIKLSAGLSATRLNHGMGHELSGVDLVLTAEANTLALTIKRGSDGWKSCPLWLLKKH